MLIIASLLILGTVAAAICLYHYIGMPKCIGEKKYKYKTKKISVTYDNICLYGKALVPISNKEKKFKTVIYAHGALSSHKTDISTLKSLAKTVWLATLLIFTAGPQKAQDQRVPSGLRIHR